MESPFEADSLPGLSSGELGTFPWRTLFPGMALRKAISEENLCCLRRQESPSSYLPAQGAAELPVVAGAVLPHQNQF